DQKRGGDQKPDETEQDQQSLLHIQTPFLIPRESSRSSFDYFPENPSTKSTTRSRESRIPWKMSRACASVFSRLRKAKAAERAVVSTSAWRFSASIICC